MDFSAVGDLVGLDLLVIEVFSETPKLETAAEICLREAELGRRVAFAFLDIDNFDDLYSSEMCGPLVNLVSRRIRAKRLKAIERILSSRGVIVIPDVSSNSRPSFSLDDEGIENTDSLRAYNTNGAALGIGVLSSLMRYKGDSDPEFLECRRLIERLLAEAYQAFDLTRSLISVLRPKTLLLFNGRFACARGIREAARISGVEISYHEIGGALDRYSFSTSSPFCRDSDREAMLSTWANGGSDREAIAEGFFAPSRAGALLREARYLDRQRSGLSLPATRKRRIVFFTSSVDELAAVEERVEHPLFDSQQSAAKWLASWVCARPDTELVIRIHPRMRRLSPQEWQRWSRLAGENVVILPAASAVDSYALALSADRVVAYHSSMGAEATFLGQVSILIGDATYRGLDCVYEPRTIPEFEWMLETEALPPKSRDGCLPFGYYRLMGGYRFRFYQPSSLTEGKLLGQPLLPSRGTFLDQVLVKTLKVPDRLIRYLRTVVRRGRSRRLERD